MSSTARIVRLFSAWVVAAALLGAAFATVAAGRESPAAPRAGDDRLSAALPPGFDSASFDGSNNEGHYQDAPSDDGLHNAGSENAYGSRIFLPWAAIQSKRR